MSRRQNRSRNLGLRLAALASVSLIALPAVAEVWPLTTTLVAPTVAPGTVKPFYGNIRPFYGNLRPFYGNLRPFYGNLRPFWGNLRPFWGDTGAFYGDLKAFWGVDDPAAQSKGAPDYRNVGDFWTTQGNDWDAIASSWSTAQPGGFEPVAGELQTMINASRDFWGAAVIAKTGKSFDEGFAAPLLARYGIDLADPDSLAKLDETDRAIFFLEWYDGLMNFSGTDHVDHWMRAINWTPALATASLASRAPVIGLLDQTVVGDKTLARAIVRADGVSTFTNGHGAAVASLIVGAHDGQGVMGVAPHAQVVAYNPFDDTGTANWADITTGVQKLKAEGAGVVNASLGVPGVTFDRGWNDVFRSLAVTLTLKNTIFVMAAGNEGVTQTNNVAWSLLNPAFIVVGSVDVEGNISNFSNRPGNACLTPLLGLCTGDYLKNHFVVAPGELMLVDDGHGGVTRQIGTSFAAPLVSGAVALIHDRWPWLVNFPVETANIILNSARDLGEPGVDPVYGHGLLDVTASQSPLDFNKLVWYSAQNGQKTLVSSKAVVATFQAHDQATWDAKNAYFYAYERLGLLTQRDFAIPLASKLVGQTVTGVAGSQARAMGYLTTRLDGWAATQTTTGLTASGFNGFSGVNVKVPNAWGADMTMTFAPRTKREGYVDERPDYQSALNIRGEHASMVVGFGDGAPALAQTGFIQGADYDAEHGGANPLLGLASGGGYAGWSYGLNPKLKLTAGVLERNEQRDTRALPTFGVVGNGAASYQAAAQIVSLAYTPTDAVTFTGAYTHLSEASGLLGIQSLDPADFRGGTTTDGYSLGVNWALGPKLSVMATGTMGKTRQGADSQQLAVDGRGLTSSAFEVGLLRSDLFKSGDRLQLSLSQPMFVEKGRLNLQSVQVIDRQSGELGVVNQSIDIGGRRRLAGEALYALPISGGNGDVSMFGRVETVGDRASAQTYLAGARYRIRF